MGQHDREGDIMIHGSACTKTTWNPLGLPGFCIWFSGWRTWCLFKPISSCLGCFLMYLLGTGHKTCYMQVHWCCMQIPTLLVTVNFKSATQKFPDPKRNVVVDFSVCLILEVERIVGCCAKCVRFWKSVPLSFLVATAMPEPRSNSMRCCGHTEVDRGTEPLGGHGWQ